MPVAEPQVVLPPDLGDAHHRMLERLYHAAPSNAFTPATMQLAHGEAWLSMELPDEYRQAVGMVHGMIPCKVIDEIGFYAAQSVVEDVWLTTAALNVQFLGPVEVGGQLHGHARVVHAGRSSITVEVLTWRGDNSPVARGTGTFVRTKTALRSAG
jgi:uncharacterized protein (TIGR00369 family)